MNNEPKAAIDADGFASLVEMIGEDAPEIVVEILDTYGEESAQLLESVAEFASAGRLEDMLRPVHSLKSSSASMGALRLSQLCADLEEHLRGFGPGVDVDEYAMMIQVEYARVQSELAILRTKYAAR